MHCRDFCEDRVRGYLIILLLNMLYNPNSVYSSDVATPGITERHNCVAQEPQLLRVQLAVGHLRDQAEPCQELCNV